MRRGASLARGCTRRVTARIRARPVHHIIDPRTGRPSLSTFVAASVIAGAAWLAEVMTKAVLLATSVEAAARALSAAGAAGLVIDRDGRCHRLAGIDRFLS